MKYATVTIVALAVMLYSGAAFAQHGHGTGGAMGPSMGPGSMGPGNSMGHGNASTHGTSSTTNQQPTVNDLLKINPTIAQKIQTLTKMPAQTACSGFKNLGRCVAAAHVANNHLGITFTCLKDEMQGITPTQSDNCPAGTGTKGTMSLGQAIQGLSPNTNQSAETKKAQKQAAQDMKDSKSS